MGHGEGDHTVCYVHVSRLVFICVNFKMISYCTTCLEKRKVLSWVRQAVSSACILKWLEFHFHNIIGACGWEDLLGLILVNDLLGLFPLFWACYDLEWTY